MEHPLLLSPRHFLWDLRDGIGTITFNRPEKKNPLTFEMYRELVDSLRRIAAHLAVKTVVIRGAGGNFCSGGDVHEIIGPLTKMNSAELLAFTSMTCDLIAEIRALPQVVIAAIDGVCAGAGAAIAMAADLRLGSAESRVAFLFTKVGLAGCDMGACLLLPRLIGLGRATELLLSGRFMTADEALAWGFYNRVVARQELHTEAAALAAQYATGPLVAYTTTKRALDSELSMELGEALRAEAMMQAKCMETNDFKRAHQAFVNKQKPFFQGN